MAHHPKEYAAGLAAMQAAARLTEAVRGAMVAGEGGGQLAKQDRSPVTVADFGVQALVCRLLSEFMPEAAIVAEEDSALLRGSTPMLTQVARFVSTQLGTVGGEMVCHWIDQGQGEPTGRYWVLDPIDGTKGFLRGGQYAIALALIEEGVVEWGFLACPRLPHSTGDGAIFVARRSGGTEILSLDGALLGSAHTSEVQESAEARLVESVEGGHTDHSLSDHLQGALNLSWAPLRMDSQAKYAAVARGEAELYLRLPTSPDYREAIWDHAAGALIVEEAGGKVTDIYGQPLDWSQGRRLAANQGIVASNGYLHAQVLEALATLSSTK